MRKSKRSVLFVAICLLVFLCVALNKGLMGLGIIPEKNSSSLEGREYAKLLEITAATIADGTFQESFDQYVSDGVPMRDVMVLANAAVQRMGIASVSRFFGYPAYPTFYGSDYVYVPEYDAILPIALKAANQEAAYARVHDTLASFATRHPERKVFVLEVDNPANSSANPTYNLVSNPAGTDDMHRSMRDGLPKNVTMVGHDCPDSVYLVSAYYRTDHHWKADEAYRSYTEALTVMMPEGEPVPYEERTFDYTFVGSTGRAGLMFPAEPVSLMDYHTDLSTCSIAIDGKSVSREAFDSWDRYSRHERNAGIQWQYGDYYHDDVGFLEIHNTAAQDAHGLLIVGNSYTNCMERFFAANYAHVYKIDARHTNLRADDFLEKHPEVEQILVVGQVGPITAGALEAE